MEWHSNQCRVTEQKVVKGKYGG